MIVGVSEKGEQDWENRNIFLPITTAQRIHAGRDRVHSFALTVDATSIEEVEVIEANIRSKMATNHQFDPEDMQAIGMWNKLERYQEFQMIFTGMKGYLVCRHR